MASQDASLESIENSVLGYLQANEQIPNSEDFSISSGINHAQLLNVIKSLNGFSLVEATDIKKETWVLTEEGEKYADSASPEVQVFEAVPPEGIPIKELEAKMDKTIFGLGKANAMKNRWLFMEGNLIKKKVEKVEDITRQQLLALRDGQEIQGADALKKRNLIKRQVWQGCSVRKGSKFAPRRWKPATDLTRDLLQKAGP